MAHKPFTARWTPQDWNQFWDFLDTWSYTVPVNAIEYRPQWAPRSISKLVGKVAMGLKKPTASKSTAKGGGGRSPVRGGARSAGRGGRGGRGAGGKK